jgi:glycosyltransferase involved in cell wall biosynthesis
MLQFLCRLCWDRLPLPVAWKRSLRDRLFAACPAVFRRLPAYQRWLLFRPAAVDRHPREAADRVPPATATEAASVRAIAMYLPQFHRIPENDRWWGAGFTEWTNVRRGRPFYAGHDQPHVPHHDIGYYDLDDPDVLERQAALARRHGIHGFCFYAYWFNGRRLLEKPLDRLVASGRPDFPFCVCWANEHWTRNWDGLEQEVLIANRHEPADDLRFIQDLMPMLRDRRAIRVAGRPLLLVYHAAALPDPARTAAVWREACRAAGVGELHLASVWSRDRADPRSFGFDAAVQFPPLLVPCENLVGAEGPAPAADFRGAILDYHAAVGAGLADLPEAFPVYRGVMPSWDNTARRLERGTSWIHASPEAYGRWLRGAVSRTCREQPAERRLVFINAWNEWAEGCHLEPDVRHGYRYLEETRAALAGGDAGAVTTDAGPAAVLKAGSPAFHERLAAADRSILVDLLFCQPGFHGGGEYGKAVFAALVRAAPDRIWVAFNPGVFMEPWVAETCRAAGVPIVAVASHAAIAALVAAGDFDTFFTPGLVAYAGLLPQMAGDDQRRRTRVVGTVHDIREATLANGPPALAPAAFARLIGSDRIETIVTVSEHSRREILRVFGPPRPRLVVLAAPEKRRVAPEPFSWAGRDFATLDYALVVNAGRPEKNAAAAVRAFDAIFGDPATSADSAGLHVVVAGVDTVADVARVRHPHRFTAVPPLPAARFEFLLAGCRFLVYPSLEEGFGYPPVEALRHGRPSVVADIGAVREVCGSAAVACDPHSDAAIAAAIRRMLRTPVAPDLLATQHETITARQRADLDRLVSLLLTPVSQPAPAS